MINAYDNTSDTSNYYNKFWARRKAEKNEITVLKILNETNDYFNKSKEPIIDNGSMNNQLLELIRLNVYLNNSDSLNRGLRTLKYFTYLHSIGLEHSAYNLIFELNESKNLNINKDSLLSVLKYDTIPEPKYWMTRNSAEWVKTYRDNGP